MPANAKSNRAPSIQFRFRIRRGNDVALGPGKADLLAAVAATGSISEAARRMGMSYNRAWHLIQTMNHCFDEPLILASRGGNSRGGAGLTTAGKKLLALYRQLEQDAEAATGETWAEIRSCLKP